MLRPIRKEGGREEQLERKGESRGAGRIGRAGAQGGRRPDDQTAVIIIPEGVK